MKRIVHAVDRAAGGVGGDRGKQRGIEDAEAHFLAFHVAAAGVDAQVCGIADCPTASACQQHQDAADEHHEHRRPDRPAMPLVLDHPAKVIGQPGGDREDREHLNEIAQRRGILKRMGGVGVEESAAVGAQHLDGDLRSDRSLRDGLRGGLLPTQPGLIDPSHWCTA